MLIQHWRQSCVAAYSMYLLSQTQLFSRLNVRCPQNQDPCERMIGFLKEYFQPEQAKDSKSSLAIRSGKGGARLSHDHSKQYAYVLQSLTLWRDILHGMF